MNDNGSQYSNTRNLFNSTHEFKEFAKEWGFRHTTSSPEYPQSNGAAERAVQTAKRILKKAAADHKDPFEGLLKYRNTPFQDIGVSPVQLLMSRRTRTMIPTHRRLLLPQAVDPDRVVKGTSTSSRAFQRATMTNRVETCLHLRWGTKCEFVQIGSNSGAKQKCYQGPISWKMNKDVSTEEIGDRSSQSQMINPCIHQLRDAMAPQLDGSLRKIKFA